MKHLIALTAVIVGMVALLAAAGAVDGDQRCGGRAGAGRNGVKRMGSDRKEGNEVKTKKAGATFRQGNAQRTNVMRRPRGHFTTKLEDTVNGVLRIIAWTGGLVSIFLAAAGVDGTADLRTVAGLGLFGLVLCLAGLLAGRMEDVR